MAMILQSIKTLEVITVGMILVLLIELKLGMLWLQWFDGKNHFAVQALMSFRTRTIMAQIW